MSPGQAPGDPRVAHYLYAHRAVPRAFLRDPAAIIGILSSADGTEFLRGMWGVIDQELEPDQRLTDQTISLDHYECEAGVYVSIVTMPPPQRVFEAFFVALAIRLEGEVLARAFTLDRATPIGKPLDVGILEWDAEGRHTLCEGTCETTPSAFVSAVEALFAGPQERFSGP